MGAIHRVCDVGDLSPGQARTFWVEGRAIALFNVDGMFYATENECTHEGGALGGGVLRGDRVLCPLHGAEFDVKTGAALSPPADFGVETFRVVVEGGEVKVELP